MKRRRIKLAGSSAVYHCISRAVAGEPIFGEREKEVFRKQIWQIADFCGVEILTYCIMSNHFHILVRVPDATTISLSNEELLRRYGVLYSSPSEHQMFGAENLESIFDSGGKDAEVARDRLLALMHDVSAYMKMLKQRFARWYNMSKGRYGTLWAERFKSVLVEGDSPASRVVAAYIDLNPVRAGIVKDPAMYRWSGYGEAMGGGRGAQKGLLLVEGVAHWAEARSGYRRYLYSMGALDAHGKGGSAARIDGNTALNVIENQKGELGPITLVRHRVRYFTQGLAIGSKDYVARILEDRYKRNETKLLGVPRCISGFKHPDITVGRGMHMPYV